MRSSSSRCSLLLLFSEKNIFNISPSFSSFNVKVLLDFYFFAHFLELASKTQAVRMLVSFSTRVRRHTDWSMLYRACVPLAGWFLTFCWPMRLLGSLPDLVEPFCFSSRMLTDLWTCLNDVVPQQQQQQQPLVGVFDLVVTDTDWKLCSGCSLFAKAQRFLNWN